MGTGPAAPLGPPTTRGYGGFDPLGFIHTKYVCAYLCHMTGGLPMSISCLVVIQDLCFSMELGKCIIVSVSHLHCTLNPGSLMLHTSVIMNIGRKKEIAIG